MMMINFLYKIKNLILAIVSLHSTDHLATVAVTSCSAECVMSRVKIIKNRLRSTMLDDWFLALTILASEHDIVDSLNSDDITGRFALSSSKLQKHLNFP